MCYNQFMVGGAGVKTKTISLRDANQGFARCVRDVEAGEDFIITRNRTPVARLLPVVRQALSPAQEAAMARTQARMDKGWHLGAEGLDRDSLHEG